jgi:BirA family biotin operon repressor/biotin-[acetyl-CoA-carboxylase] ligase
MVGGMGTGDVGERVPLDEAALSRAVIRPGGFWRSITVTGRTGSTNTDLLARAAGGAPEGSVLAAEEQTAGRGRMGRSWQSPPGAALTFSVLLRPAGVPPGRRGWVPLLTGIAVVTAVRNLTGLDARLKWPNDVLVGDRKLAGILAEQAGDAIVAGVGVNVSSTRAELPVPAATSLTLEGAAGTGRERLLVAVLGELEHRYLVWTRAESPGDADGSGLREEYRRCSATLGRRVRVEFPGGDVAEGTALDVDAAGRLMIRAPGGDLEVSAGDVVHLR